MDVFFITLIATFAGAAAGSWVSWLLMNRDKQKNYLINSKNVLLIMAMQLNRFESIKRGFHDEYQKFKMNPGILPPSFLIDGSDWQLSRRDILLLHKNNCKENMNIVYDLMHLSKDFVDLIYSIKDYNKMLIQKECAPPIKFTQEEYQVQVIYLVSIDKRIHGLNIQQNTENLYKYLKKMYPSEIFPQPFLKKDVSQAQV